MAQESTSPLGNLVPDLRNVSKEEWEELMALLHGPKHEGSKSNSQKNKNGKAKNRKSRKNVSQR